VNDAVVHFALLLYLYVQQALATATFQIQQPPTQLAALTLLPLSSRLFADMTEKPLTEEEREDLLEAFKNFDKVCKIQ
jgi:hypothetical protein